MDLANVGFGIFLVLLLIAPNIPVPGFSAEVNMSPGAAGLVIWLMLAWRMPVRAFLTMPTLLALIGFSVYILLTSLMSASLVSIAYALQYGFYAILGGILIPAYIAQKTRQGRQAEVWRIIAWVGGIYAAGIFASLWVGPIYPHQVGTFVKHYGAVDIIRGVGFSESTNAAGGVAAVFAACCLFLYRPKGRFPLLMAIFTIAGLAATLSRSAIAAFGLALCLFGLLVALRFVLVGTLVRKRSTLVPVAFVLIAVFGGMASSQHPIVAAAWERLFADQDELTSDVDDRIKMWTRGAEAWADKPLAQQMLGSGFRSNQVSRTGAYDTAHNVYVEMLNDFGLVGVLIFLAVLLAALTKAAYRVFVGSADSMSRFCLVGLTTLVIHNMTQVFFYGVGVLTFVIVLLTCGELAIRERRAGVRVSARPPLPMPRGRQVEEIP